MMSDCTTVYLGASVDLTAYFLQDGQRVEPSTVALVVTNSYTDTSTTYAKTDMTINADNEHLLTYTPTAAGEHIARWTSTTPSASYQINFVVLP